MGKLYYFFLLFVFLFVGRGNAQVVVLNAVSPGSPLCAGEQIQVTYTAAGFATPGVFGIELSDPSGSFAAPVVLWSGNHFVGNFTQGANLPVTLTPGSAYAIRVVRYTAPASSSNIFPAVTINTQQVSLVPRSTVWCAGDLPAIDYSICGVFAAGNDLSVQLSNGSGSFASPVNIGTLSDITSGNGTLNVNIPSNTPAGNTYRIRITTTNPVITDTSTLPVTIVPAALCNCPYDSLTIEWQADWGGNDVEIFQAMAPTADNGYLLGGISYSAATGNKTSNNNGQYDIWVVKMDAAGNKAWEATFGGTLRDGGLEEIVPLPDGGFLLCGYSESTPSGNKTSVNYGLYDIWIIRINAAGTKLWERTYGGSADDLLGAAIALADGGFLLGGNSSSGISGNKTTAGFTGSDYWLIRTDAQGNKLWEKVFGGDNNDDLSSLLETPDGGFLLGGSSASDVSGNKTSARVGLNDFWVIKTDNHGNKTWEAVFGGTSQDNLNDMVPTQDGGYLLAGSSNSPVSGNKTAVNYGNLDYWLVKINAAGTKSWEQSYGGTAPDQAFDITPTVDGGYFLGGESASDANGNKTVPRFNATYDYWFFKVDANGNKLLEHVYGGTAADVQRQTLATADGGFLVSGYTSTNISGNKTVPNFNNSSDYWAIKVKPFVEANLLAAPRTSTVCAGDLLHVGYELRCLPFQVGNTLTVQLSNAAGSFSSPVLLGAFPTTVSTDTLAVTIPALTPPGTAYSVRIYSSNPADTAIITGLSVFNGDTSYVTTGTVCTANPSLFNTTDTTLFNILSNQWGCDSLIYHITTYREISDTTQTVSICAGNSYFAGGANQTNAGTYTDTLSSFYGCDSIIATILTVHPADTTYELRPPICAGDPAFYNQFDTVLHLNTVNQNGCDSLHFYIAELLPPDTVYENVPPLCAGDPAVYNTFDTVLFSSIPNQFGCDSVHYRVAFLLPPDTTSEILDTICSAPGWPGSVDTVNTSTVSNRFGCDSTHFSIVIALRSDTLTVFQTSCDPADVGVSTDTFTNQVGCDSIRTLVTTLVPSVSVTVDASICPGSTYLLPDGSSVNAAGSYPVTLPAANGCDSIVTTNLVLTTVLNTTVDAQICTGQSYTLPGGNVVTATGTYADTLSSAAGCDSVVTTNLVLTTVLNTTVNAQICTGQSYTLPGGNVVTTAGTYTDTLSSAAGCDSVVTTNLVLTTVLNTTVDAQICAGQSYTLPGGNVVTTAGMYTDTLSSAVGCDSVVTTNLVLTNVLNTTVDAQICTGQSYTLPGGNVVTTAGTYTDTLTSAAGCDSVVTTNLTLTTVLNTTVDAQICTGQAYTLPGGNVVTTAGTYVDTLISTAGCDSVVTTNLTLTTVLNTTVDTQICTGQSYTLPGGNIVTTAGTYADTLSSAAGCDSVVTTNLVLTTVLNTTVDAQICTGQAYTLPGGTVVTAAGTYADTLSSAAGCDSVITTNLVLTTVLNTTVDAQICTGQAYTLPGGNVVTAAGTYTDTLSSAAGCDSVITTNLVLTTVLNTTVDAQICTGQAYTLPGGNVVTAAGTYADTLSSAAGCDSVVTTNLTLSNVLNTTVDVQICTGQAYTLPGGNVVTTAGTYTDTLTSTAGCDSVITTNLALTTVLNSTVDAQICTGQSYTLPGGNVVTTAGTYADTLSSAAGCDSVVTTNLSVNNIPIVELGEDIFLCPDDTAILNAGNPGALFTWNTGDTTAQIAVSLPGTYRVIVLLDNCSAEDEVDVLAEDCLPCGLFMPSAFSPNGDGVNDLLLPLSSCEEILPPFRFIIFNRWQEKIFDSDIPSEGWDGTFDGTPQPVDTYLYSVSFYDDILQKTIHYRGVVTLLR